MMLCRKSLFHQAGLLLRALDVDWTLPSHLLPSLPRHFDRRGLFVLTPSTGYFSITASDKKMLQIRRTGFTVASASARIVYSAQGEQYDATLPDLAIPPGMQTGVHWLACYVMLSRATSLDGLLILRLATRAQLSAGAPAYLREAVDKLLVLERQSAASLQTQLRAYREVLPSEILCLFSDAAVAEETSVFARAQADRTASPSGTLSKRPRTANEKERAPRLASEPTGVACRASPTPSQIEQAGNMALAQGSLASAAQLPASPQHATPVTNLGDVAFDRGPALCFSPVQGQPRGCEFPALVTPTVTQRNDSTHIEVVDMEACDAAVPQPAHVWVSPTGRDGGVVLGREEPAYLTPRSICGRELDPERHHAVGHAVKPDSTETFDMPVRGATSPSSALLSSAVTLPSFGMRVPEPEDPLSAPTRWTLHNAHVALLNHFLGHWRRNPQEFHDTLWQMVSKKRRQLRDDFYTCAVLDDFYAPTLPLLSRSSTPGKDGMRDDGVASERDPASSSLPKQTRGRQPESEYAAGVNTASSFAGSRRVAQQQSSAHVVLQAPAAGANMVPENAALLEPTETDVAEFLGYTGPIGGSVDNVQCGLHNMGNTCYLNALLHALARIPSIRSWCDLHQRRFATDMNHGHHCVLCHLALDLSSIAVDITPMPLAPQTVRMRSVWSKGEFANFSQHDVHDAFCMLLDECEGVDYRMAKDLNLPLFFKNGGTNSLRYSTPFWKAFGGVLKSSTFCRACGHAESRYEMWHNLELALPPQAATLEQILANHWGREPLQSENDECPSCHVLRQRDKEVQLEKWPQVLALVLKRWQVTSFVPFRQEKVPVRIDFEALLPIAVAHAPYHLRAVVLHSGVAGGGHYTSYVRSPDHRWYFCDDEAPPRETSVNQVLSERSFAEAYMLFYEQ